MYPALHGVTHGQPDKPAVLFLHGFLGAQDDWSPVIQALSDSFYCMAVDLPGHGRTPTCDDPAFYTLPGAADAVAAYLRDRGVRAATVIGYSMGGRLALYLACHESALCRRVIIESSSPGLLDVQQGQHRVAQDAAWADRLVTEPLPEVLRNWYAQPLFASLRDHPAAYEAMVKRRLRNRPNEVARALRGMSVGAQQPLWDRLETLTQPILVLAGERDLKYRKVAEAMEARNTSIAVRLVPGAGHNAHTESPAAVSSLVRDWLEPAH